MDTIRTGRVTVVSKFGGIKMEGDETWYNPIKKSELLDNILANKEVIKGGHYQMTLSEETGRILRLKLLADPENSPVSEETVENKQPSKSPDLVPASEIGEPLTPSGLPTGARPDRDTLIVRQACIKAVCELNSDSDEPPSTPALIEQAKQFEAYIWGKE